MLANSHDSKIFNVGINQPCVVPDLKPPLMTEVILNITHYLQHLGGGFYFLLTGEKDEHVTWRLCDMDLES